MARRYKRRIDWHWLRSITETSLNESGRFPGKVHVDGKMEWIESGLYHDNYRFWIRGLDLHKEWKDKPLMLRIRSQKRPLRSRDEAGNYLNRETKTLQRLENAGFRFETPDLICGVGDDFSPCSANRLAQARTMRRVGRSSITVPIRAS